MQNYSPAVRDSSQAPETHSVAHASNALISPTATTTTHTAQL